MVKKLKEEVKADGEDSATHDTVSTGSVKRPKDKTQGDKSADKVEGDVTKKGGGSNSAKQNVGSVGGSMSKSQAMEKIREAVSKLFDDEDSKELSESFKHRVATLFEAALIQAAEVMGTNLEEQYQTVLDTYQNDMMERLDSYASFVAEEWTKDNRLQVENGIRSELAESFITGLQELMAEHNVSLPEEDIDVVAEMTEEIEELKQKLNESQNKLFEVSMEQTKTVREEIVSKLSEGLADTQADKLSTLAETISYDDMEDFEKKLTIVKEKFFATKTKTPSSGKVITEELDTVSESETVISDPYVARIAERISKSR